MGNVSHLCSHPLTDDASMFSSCITWWHSRGTDVFGWIHGELQCERHGFSLFARHFAESKVISCTARGSMPRNRAFPGLHVVKQRVPDCTITHAYSLLCKWPGLLGRFLISFSIIQFPPTRTSFRFLSHCFWTSNPWQPRYEIKVQNEKSFCRGSLGVFGCYTK